MHGAARADGRLQGALDLRPHPLGAARGAEQQCAAAHHHRPEHDQEAERDDERHAQAPHARRPRRC